MEIIRYKAAVRRVSFFTFSIFVLCSLTQQSITRSQQSESHFRPVLHLPLSTQDPNITTTPQISSPFSPKMAATGKHAPWRLWILIVIWVFQLLFLLASAGIYVIAMVALFRTITYTDSSGNRTTYTATTAFRIGTIVQLILIVLSLILTLVEIVKCGRLRLSPKYYLVSNVIKTIIWVGLCIASLVVVNYDGTKNAGTIVVSIIMMYVLSFSPLPFPPSSKNAPKSPTKSDNSSFLGSFSSSR